MSEKPGTPEAAMTHQIEQTLMAMRKTVEMMQSQLNATLEAVQYMQIRIDALERQTMANTAAVMPFAAAAQGLSPFTAPTPTNHNPGSPTQPLPSAMMYMPGHTPTTEPSPATKQLEDDFQRLGLRPFGSATTHPQSQQQQRDEAFMNMLNSQIHSTSGTPTLPGPNGMGGGSTTTMPLFPNSNSPVIAGQPLCSPLQHPQPGMMPPPSSMMPPSAMMGGGMPPQMYGFDPNAAAVAAMAAMMGTVSPGGTPSASNVGGGGNGNNGGGGGNNGAGGSHSSSAAAAAAAGAAAAAAAAGMQTAVTLDPARSTSEMLERACQQTWLKELNLKGCKNISNFNPIARLKNLWKLSLQGCAQYVDDSVVKLIGTYNRRLSRLNLCGCERITDATPLSQLSFLFDLNLSGCQIGNNSLEAISRGCGQLSRLAINSCPQLTSVSCVGNLKELKLLYCRYSGNIAPSSITDVLNAIGSSLLTLNIDGVKFSQLDLTHLPPVTALKNLNFKDNTEVTNLDWITSLPNFTKVFSALEMLDVEGCSNLSSLGPIASLPALKTVRLSHTAISVTELAKLTSSQTITSVYLEGCPLITSVECLTGLNSLSKLVVDQQMQSGNLAANGITAVRQRGGVDIVFASPNTNAHMGGSAAGGHGTLLSPLTSPTGNYVPPMPSAADVKPPSPP